MTASHSFQGQWITDGEFASLEPRNVFHRQLQKVDLPCVEHRDRHILFRKKFVLSEKPEQASMFITADDYYKLYINGVFVAQGPSPSYIRTWGYNEIDVTSYLREGENTLAVHTLYQGLINRVWISGDLRHGLLCDLVADGQTVLQSDGTFLTHPHTAYTELGTVGYQTQFMERQDSNAPECGFARPDFDDSGWTHALPRKYADYVLVPQQSKMLVFEEIAPAFTERRGDTLFVDFGAMYVGTLRVTAKGRKGSAATIRCAQELNPDGSARYDLRCNCRYEETWIFSGDTDTLDQFDYKSFRYAEIVLPEGCEISEIRLWARHYPFELKASLKPEFRGDPTAEAIWNLCVRSIRYGVQEVIQDCMDREKGFYLGDGCYTALVQLILTGDDSIVRKLIEDSFTGTFITPGMVTCLDCSFMQEIAEYPLMLVSLMLWHWRVTGDRSYLERYYDGVCSLLESYRRDYERDGLLRDLDKWCVVEWPANYRDGYDVDITEGKVCHEPHVAINSYYVDAVRNANGIARILGKAPYRDEAGLVDAFTKAFYDPERHLFRDSLHSDHVSMIGNVLPFSFGLCPDEACEQAIVNKLETEGYTKVMLFGGLPALRGLTRIGRADLVRRFLLADDAWSRMLREGATSSFEGWGKNSKWNTSLFHLTMNFAVIFLADIDANAILG